MGFPVALVVKNGPANMGDIRHVRLIPESGRVPRRRKGQPTPVFLLHLTRSVYLKKKLGGPHLGAWRRAWQPTPEFLPGESHGQRSLAGCSPGDCRESDVTEVPWHAQGPLQTPQKSAVGIHDGFLSLLPSPFLPPVPTGHHVSSPVSSPIIHSLLQPQRAVLSLSVCVCISRPF